MGTALKLNLQKKRNSQPQGVKFETSASSVNKEDKIGSFDCGGNIMTNNYVSIIQ